MKLSIRLDEVLEHFNDGGRGAATRISNQVESLSRHQVAAILNNRSTPPVLNTLAGICEYLINEHHVDRAKLPGLLLRLEPEALMSLVADQAYLGVCVGMRTEGKSTHQQTAASAADSTVKATKRQSVTAADAYLLGVVLHDLFGGRTTEQEIDQRLIAAHGLKSDATHAGQQAEAVYEHFREAGAEGEAEAGRALACLGSVKSNPVAEFIMAHTFGSTVFKHEDGVSKPADRHCPIFLQYRKDDFSPPSCHGGRKLARGRSAKKPGIYFEQGDGKWECCPCELERDAAFVMYAHHVPESRVEMILGGFSGRATFCLAKALPHLGKNIWPPNYKSDPLEVGAFVVRFEFSRSDGKANNGQDSAWTYNPTKTDVVALEEEVLKRRLERLG